MKTLLTTFLIFITINIYSQNYDPVEWSYGSKKIADKRYNIYLKAHIAKGWHLYALDPGEGPVPTQVQIKPNPIVKLVKVPFLQKGKRITEFDKNFNSKLSYYKDSLILTSDVQVKVNSKTKINGSIKYMVCDDSKCLPPTTKYFYINLN